MFMKNKYILNRIFYTFSDNLFISFIPFISGIFLFFFSYLLSSIGLKIHNIINIILNVITVLKKTSLNEYLYSLLILLIKKSELKLTVSIFISGY